MNLDFDTSLASGYKSASQIARVLTEAWFDKEMYCFVDRLSKMHPDNEHVEAKIRQQLQVLRDEGVVEFLDGRGRYRVRY